MKFRSPFPQNRKGLPASLPRAYTLWLVLALVVLVGSLFLLAVAVTAAFINFGNQITPLWVILLGVLAIFGIAAGFLTLAAMLGIAGYRSFKESRRTEILPPERR